MAKYMQEIILNPPLGIPSYTMIAAIIPNGQSTFSRNSFVGCDKAVHETRIILSKVSF